MQQNKTQQRQNIKLEAAIYNITSSSLTQLVFFSFPLFRKEGEWKLTYSYHSFASRIPAYINEYVSFGILTLLFSVYLCRSKKVNLVFFLFFFFKIRQQNWLQDSYVSGQQPLGRLTSQLNVHRITFFSSNLEMESIAILILSKYSR